jgi:hypothetical protein
MALVDSLANSSRKGLRVCMIVSGPERRASLREGCLIW